MNKLILVLAAGISLTACQQNSKKSSGNLDKDVKDLVKKAPGLNAGTGTFTIEATEGWVKTDTSLGGLQATLLKSALEGEADVFMENINVVTEKTAGMDLDKYFEANVNTLSTQMAGYTKISSGNQIINGEECRRLTYSHTYTGTETEVETYFFVKNGIGYIITCSTEKGKLEKWKPSFDKVVNTFTIQ